MWNIKKDEMFHVVFRFFLLMLTNKQNQVTPEKRAMETLKSSSANFVLQRDLSMRLFIRAVSFLCSPSGWFGFMYTQIINISRSINSTATIWKFSVFLVKALSMNFFLWLTKQNRILRVLVSEMYHNLDRSDPKFLLFIQILGSMAISTFPRNPHLLLIVL